MSEKKSIANKLYVHDNLDILHGLNSNSVDLIYLDPPFNSKRIYQAPIGSPAGKKAAAKGKAASFYDIWTWDEDVDIRLESVMGTHSGLFAYIDVVGEINGLAMKAYLTFMAQRIIEMHRVLKDTGSLYLHCDPTASHYLKLVLDLVFGKQNFRNEIVWGYTGPSNAHKQFPRKHDTVFFYAKSDDALFYRDAVRVPYSEETLARRGRVEGESSYISPSVETSDRRDQAQVETKFGYGKVPESWWSDIASLTNQRERTGYPTQKPLALLDRIIKASSNEGDLVLDPFCGCATTCVAAQNLHRKWIGIDISPVAGDLIADRLGEEEEGNGTQKLLFTDFEIIKRPPVRTDLEKLTWPKDRIRKHFYGEQAGKCNGCGTHFEMQHFHIDHIYPESKGGAWQLDNLQLLCGNCNSVKGDRPMEYLMKRIKQRKRQLALLGG